MTMTEYRDLLEKIEKSRDKIIDAVTSLDKRLAGFNTRLMSLETSRCNQRKFFKYSFSLAIPIVAGLVIWKLTHA